MDELRIVQEELTWQNFANCLGINPDIFYPDRGGDNSVAKAICGECVVRVDCLQHALENSERFGIWGGTSERERQKIRRALKVENELNMSTLNAEQVEGGDDSLGDTTGSLGETAPSTVEAQAPKNRFAFIIGHILTEQQLEGLFEEPPSYMLDEIDEINEGAW